MDAPTVTSEQPEVPEYLSSQTERFAENLARVSNLTNLHEFLTGLSKGMSGYDASDVLRSAVVLLHASLEDFLRSIASAHLPRTDNEFIQNMLLAGKPRSGKYTIGDLVQHRGKSIDQVLDESIDQWLETHSFNHADDIRGMLSELGMPVEYFSETYEKLGKMIARRHLIVHRADRDTDGNVTMITSDDVTSWVDNVEKFMRRAIYQLQFVSQKPEQSK